MQHIEKLREYFPGCKFILPIRDPKEAVSSWVQLCSVSTGSSMDVPHFIRFMQLVYKYGSRPCLRKMVTTQVPQDSRGKHDDGQEGKTLGNRESILELGF